MSPYDGRSGRQQNHGTLNHWVPLFLSVTVATVGLAAWIWSERHDEDDPEHPEGPRPDYGRNPDGSIYSAAPSYASLRPGEAAYGTTQGHQGPQYQGPPYEGPQYQGPYQGPYPGPYPPPDHAQDESQGGYFARMSGALRRTPSPQQFFDTASRSISGGVAAVGAAVGGALSSIREEDKNAYTDHKTWSEEAESRNQENSKNKSRAPPSGPIELRSAEGVPTVKTPSNLKRKTVAIVVSADTHLGDSDEESFHEHASILSHLPRNTDFSKLRLFVLIYAPGLKEHPLDATSTKPPGSLSSSYSHIGHEQAQTPSEDIEKSLLTGSTTPTSAFNSMYSQALALVEKETMVLPFTTPTGHVHILRHLSPEVVYLQESLAGNDGDVITHLQSWLRHDVVLVVGADGGHGGLADSESEAEQVRVEKPSQWWEKEERVGRGRGVVVVEGVRVGDDWARRVQQRD